MTPDTAPIDILLYIALSEEFNHLADDLIGDLGRVFVPQELEDVAITLFVGEVFSPVLARDFHLAVVPAGKMGITRAAAVTSAVLGASPACDVVVLGIAGSTCDDLQPGDVLIPDSVDEYLANSAGMGLTTWRFETSGNHLPTSPRLLNRFQLFSQTNPSFYQGWIEGCNVRLEPLVKGGIQTVIAEEGLKFRPQVRLFAGDDRKLASGPAVAKGTAFVEWLKSEVDRKVAAIEMESAGVYDAAHIRVPAPRVIAIRGISDFGDERKKLIEDSAKDQFRAASAKNALHLLLRGIEAGLFKPEAPKSPSPEAPQALPSLPLIQEQIAARTVQLITERLSGMERHGRLAAIASSMQRISSFLHPEFAGADVANKRFGREFDFSAMAHVVGFWRSVLRDDFKVSTFLTVDEILETDYVHEGHLVHLRNASISRWVPLLPGQSFSTSMKPLEDEREKWKNVLEEDACGLEDIAYFENEAKVRSGLASLRLLPRFGEHLLCASGMFSWFGVPLVTPEAFYKAHFGRLLCDAGALTCDLTAYLRRLPGEWSDCLDKSIPEKVRREFLIPKFALVLLDVENVRSPSEVAAAAWTGFVSTRPLPGAQMFNETFASEIFPVNRPDECAISDAAERVVKYGRFLSSGLVGMPCRAVFNFDETRRWIKDAAFGLHEFDAMKSFRYAMFSHGPFGGGRRSSTEKPK